MGISIRITEKIMKSCINNVKVKRGWAFISLLIVCVILMAIVW